MIDYAIPKGFCKKLYDENQLLKHLFIPSYICFDGMKMDASNERKTSINFTYGESPFKELGLEDDVIIYTYDVYKVLDKGRQKVMYLRVTDNKDLVFIKNEDNVLLEYPIGRIADNWDYSRLTKLKECLNRVNDKTFNQVKENTMRKLLNKKITYFPCGESEIVLSLRLLGGVSDKCKLYYKYSDVYKVFNSEQNYEELFNVVFMAEFESGLKLYYMFEASAF